MYRLYFFVFSPSFGSRWVSSVQQNLALTEHRCNSILPLAVAGPILNLLEHCGSGSNPLHFRWGFTPNSWLAWPARGFLALFPLHFMSPVLVIRSHVHLHLNLQLGLFGSQYSSTEFLLQVLVVSLQVGLCCLEESCLAQ